jgi:heme oxygenase (biliverdin-IX-beta and delta-forming)
VNLAENMTILTELRSATSSRHQRAERLIGFPTTVSSHIQILKTFYGFIEPWEIRISKSLAAFERQLVGRQKLPLLTADLQNLGIDEAHRFSIPRCEHLPLLNDTPSGFGSMYVFEGATLGGQVLSRHMEQHLGLKDGDGYSFYKSYGQNVGVMWRDFGQLLTQNIPRQSFDSVIHSACETFDRLCDWFG